MIYAILAIFLTMSTAEQETIIEAACSMPSVVPAQQIYDNRVGTLSIYEDGSSTLINNDATTVRNPDGLEVYYGMD